MKPIVCLILLTPLAAIADDAVLKMHVFDVDKTEAGAHKNKSLNMIIFDENNPVEAVNKPLATKTKASPHKYWSLGLKDGYQHERLAWKTTPSQINKSWQAINLWNLQADVEFKLPVGFLARGSAAYGVSTVDSSNQYQLDLGYALEFSGAVGYEFLLGEKRNQSVWGEITPLVGYEEQTYSLSNNSYKTKWKGPWIGVDMVLGFASAHELFLNSALHWADFNGDVDVNSSRREYSAKSHGYKADIGYRFRPNDRWAVGVGFKYEHWNIKAGDESIIVTSGAVRNVYGVNVGVEYDF